MQFLQDSTDEGVEPEHPEWELIVPKLPSSVNFIADFVRTATHLDLLVRTEVTDRDGKPAIRAVAW